MTRVGVASGVAITAIGIGMRTNTFGHGGDTDPKDVAFIPLTIGLAILIPSLAMLLSEKPEPAPKAETPKPDPAVSLREQTQAKAWDLTKQAAAAARAGDCPTAVKLDGEVRALDADFHTSVTARDAAIARCVATPTPGP